MLIKNLSNMKFGTLTVVERDLPKSGEKPKWVCNCDCGATKVVLGSALIRGTTKSCGCLRKKRMRILATGNTFCRLNKGESGLRAVYRSYRANAKRKNVPFCLTVEEFKFLSSGNCYYCDAEPSNLSKKEAEWSKYRYNGLDRIDPKLGYVTENVIPCCKRDNYIRNVFLTVEETKIMVSALENYRRGPKS